MRITIEKLVYGGSGLARTDEGVIFVPRSAPGDVLEVQIAERKKDYAIARIVKILTPSADRQTPDCPNYLTAGCCHWQHIRYDRQLEYKDAILRETLKRGAHIEWPASVVRISSPDRHYRMRASFHVHSGKLGFMAEHSHTVIPIQECASLTPLLNAFVAGANRVIGTPDFTNLQEVHAVADSAVAATFIFAENAVKPEAWERVRDAVFEIPDLAALTIRAGSRHLHFHKTVPQVEVRGHRFELNSDAFFQANRFLLDPFMAEVVRQTDRGFHILELYSGAGFFSIPLAGACKELIGVESHPAALRQAKDNARTNGVRNVEFVTAEVDAILAESDVKPDVLVMNPPRAGSGVKVAARIAELKPKRIVYVSCNPATLAREADVFVRQGYGLKQLTLIDQFPNTYHIESVAQFELE